jgi:hypothetical protein
LVVRLKFSAIKHLNKEVKIMLKKLALITLVMVFMTVPALAGNIPEFDTVGNDAGNVFNDAIKAEVVQNNPINLDSDFTDVCIINDPVVPRNGGRYPAEFFDTTAAALRDDPCFGFLDYLSSKAGPWFQNIFQWRIVLQMAPETDLDLNIRDCVLKENQRDIWFYAQQTGRFRKTNGKLVFNKQANPRISVKATAGFKNFVPQGTDFWMDARRMPGLGLVCLDGPDGKLYTSKAVWEEGLVLAMPEPGGFNQCGQPVFPLREGDLITVTVDVPFNNPVDIWYGPDNVSIKYVGIIGLELVRGDL